MSQHTLLRWSRVATAGALALLAFAGRADAQAVSPFWGNLQPGPYGVGFSARYVFDESRTFWPPDSTEVHGLGRPLRILLWYPAEQSSDTTMTFGAYREVLPADRRFEYYNRVLRGMEYSTATRQFSPASDSLLAVVSALRTMARRDVPPVGSNHPLVVHSLGLGDFQLENTVLFEYLASHGYVVATVPQMNATPWEPSSFDAGSVETQSADVAFAMNLLRNEDLVEGNRVAITGHSIGGLVAFLIASRYPEVRAVVGLDASFATPDGNALLESMNWPAPSMRAVVLDIHRRRGEGVDRRSLERLTQLDRYEITLGGAAPPEIVTHFDFQNWPIYSTLVGVEDPRGASARPAEFGLSAYLATVRMTRRFLDATLGDRVLAMGNVIGSEAERVPIESKVTRRGTP